MSNIKVMIVDDHSLMRKGLAQILELENDIDVIGQACDGKEAVTLALKLKPDVILMDINMPIQNGMISIKELKEKGCASRVIMLTIHDDREYLMEAIKIGASGYVMKDAEAEHLIGAIRDVYKGKTYIQPNLSSKLIQDFDRMSYHTIKKQFQDNNLTQREIEVLMLIADGKNNREIAEELYISEKTVKNHVSNILRKIEVSDRTQAAIYAFKHHMK